MTTRETHSAPAASAANFNLAQVATATTKARDWLVAQQDPAGFWCGELEGDTILESEYILLLAWLGQEKSTRAAKAAAYILEKQLPSGGWSQYPGGTIDQSGSVKAYFALKLTGHDPEAPYMQAARRAIRENGGADKVNSFTRFYLALLGQISYDQCPAVPPEAMLLPNFFPINIYKISSWSRTILVPLAIMWAHRPARKLPIELGISELFLAPPHQWLPLRSPGLPKAQSWFSWERIFRGLDRTLKVLEWLRLKPFRRWALLKAERWMIERFAESDGLGAIFPPMIWSVIALKCLGYADESPELRYAQAQLEGLVIETADTVRLQPCKSPVWDTAIALRALAATGLTAGSPEAARGIEWLLQKEVTRKGDWINTVRAEPGGWFFEHANAFYPDVDDTAMVLLALGEQFSGGSTTISSRIRRTHEQPATNGSAKANGQAPSGANSANIAASVATASASSVSDARRLALLIDRATAAGKRGRNWIEAMQNLDGGWGAFDRNNDAEFLCYVPFADHNAMIDPSTPDLAARVVESLCAWGTTPGHAAIDRAIQYLRNTQEEDGSWFGRWGVNYIYGTWQVLVGLQAAGVPQDDPMVARGANWLERYQQPNGGWGESANSYLDPKQRGRGPVTASQTAWAVLGLIAAGRGAGTAAERGVQYLVSAQRADGGWDEPEFTGTGFPLVFYLRYHLYPIYFPLLALGQWKRAKQGE